MADTTPSLATVLFKRQMDGADRDIGCDSVPLDFARALLSEDDAGFRKLIDTGALRRAGSSGEGITPDSLQQVVLRRQRDLVEIKRTVCHLLWLAKE